MPRRKKLTLNSKYLAPRLRKELVAHLEAPFVLVEAPSGYGKTTAIEMVLAEPSLPRQAVVRFVSLEEEEPGSNWARFCRQLATIDENSAGKLAFLGLPGAENIGEITQVFSEMWCARETCLVIDNFHYWMRYYPHALLTALIHHNCPLLHIVLITQPLLDISVHLASPRAVRIGKDSFALRAEEIQAYFSAAGVAVNAQSAELIRERTEGWFAAVYLYLLHYSNTGSLLSAQYDILALMRQCVWERLPADAQQLLLQLSVFPCFSKKQVLYMLGTNDMPLYARRLLDETGFIRFDPAQKLYYPHTILLELLREVFSERDAAYHTETWTKAGQWYENNGDLLPAMACYYEVRDFERLFSLSILDVELHTAEQMSIISMMEDIVQNCPQSVKLRHPVTLLVFAYELFAAARYESYVALCEEIEALIPQSDFPDKEKNRLLGELALIRSFAVYNDIEQMGACHQAALQLIGGRSQLVDGGAPWTMGCPSVLYMFHRQAGQLAYELDCMQQNLPAYIRLGDGHGSGADHLMQAEALFGQGDVKNAEIAALRGEYLAKTSRQDSIQLVSCFLLARLAVWLEQPELVPVYREQLRQLGQSGMASLGIAADMALGHIDLLLGDTGAVAPWLQDGDFLYQPVSAPALPFAQMVHLQYCLNTKNYRRLLGLAELFMERARQSHNLLPQIYIEILLACAHYRQGETPAAQSHLKAALEMALPDDLLLPLAEYGQDVLALLATLPGALPAGSYARLKEMYAQYAGAKEQLKRHTAATRRPYALTAREYEIALLAAQRKSNMEIAEITCLSVSTVRTHLQSVYEKLKIDSKLKSKRNLLQNHLRQE